jgi:hypothetical protein
MHAAHRPIKDVRARRRVVIRREQLMSALRGDIGNQLRYLVL